MSQDRKYGPEFGQFIKTELDTILKSVSGKYELTGMIAVMVTRNDGVKDTVFTAPYWVEQVLVGDTVGSEVSRCGNISWLEEQTPIDEHVAKILEINPKVQFVCDKQTADALRRATSTVEWQSGDNDHYKLIGLATGGAVDVYADYSNVGIPPLENLGGLVYTE